MNEPRINPARKFYGTQGNSFILNLVRDNTNTMRPLAEGERVLGRFILPPFQRPLVWTERQKVRLIESLYMGLPIGALVWNQTSWGHETDGWLLDGQQRVSAILDYADGKFPVSGWLYPDLPADEQRHFQRIGVTVIESNARGVEECKDLYDRLAYGGTSHT